MQQEQDEGAAPNGRGPLSGPSVPLPSPTLFTKLPNGCSEITLQAAFESFEGFVGARVRRATKTSHTIGFVTFTDAQHAAAAMEAMQGRVVNSSTDQQPMEIVFARQDQSIGGGARRGGRQPPSQDGGHHLGIGLPPHGPGMPPHMLPGFASPGSSGGGNSPPLFYPPPTPFGPIPGMHMGPGGGGDGGGDHEGGRGGGRGGRDGNKTLPDAARFGPYSMLWWNYHTTRAPEADAFARCTLFVDGLPHDATQREVMHVFRPFPTLLSVRLLRNPSKLYPGEDHIVAFLTFDIKYIALFCMAVLNGYAFDDTTRKGLKIQVAKEVARVLL